ncbi:MAG: alpha/beta hydrolase [Bifidobacterium merycicum]|uniref:alpha/beta hydrolase family protein n=1 Tax=Bifidobacterium merycicum TaxID=78345 RepID=UPI0023F57E89|nr:alpha/beta hydrolase [Bifidobacterium merycicum]MBQ1513646.1 alpha/beta hydrolase [Bifidobacterium sp.]MEE1294793.1 alpha/beta hydrolase [Bifidobacterium merycicum]MEE3341867.1 alpha/beta hydrolase [Bifidobacterium merycicum]
MTVALTALITVLLVALLGVLGVVCTPRWRVEPFTNHITVKSSSTAIRAKNITTPQEGRYRTKETHIAVNLGGGKSVNAIVREPVGAPDGHAACLFLHGSGTGKSSEAYGDIAYAMASTGITTLVPDKRLDNYSMLSRDYESSANDYAQSLKILRAWPGVDASKTGIYAESEGTWIATVLTDEHPDLAFAILASSPVVSGRQLMAMSATNYLEAVGAPKAVTRIIPKLTSLSVQAVGPNYADFDAARYRKSMTMPLLIDYGTRDTAMPVEQGARLLTRAANAAGNRNVTVRYYYANHQIRTGSAQPAPGLPLESHYTHDLEDWVNAVAAGAGAGDWTTPMVAGAQPNQTLTAPTDTSPALVTSVGVIAGAIALCLLCALLAMLGAPVLIAAGVIRGRARKSGHDPHDDPQLAAAPEQGRIPQPAVPRFTGSLRASLIVNTVLAVGVTCVFLAYLVTVIIDAISLTSNSTVLARNWHVVTALAWMAVVAFAWLLAELVTEALRRHTGAVAAARNACHAAPDARSSVGTSSIGFGHAMVIVCVVLSAAVSLALLAFWGLFG